MSAEQSWHEILLLSYEASYEKHAPKVSRIFWALILVVLKILQKSCQISHKISLTKNEEQSTDELLQARREKKLLQDFHKSFHSISAYFPQTALVDSSSQNSVAPWYLGSHRHICAIPHFATHHAITVRYPIKTSRKEFCDAIVWKV